MSKALRILNLKVNLNGLRNDFNGLKRDPYIKEGYRWKHIVRFQLTKNGLVKAEHGPLFQSKKHNPVFAIHVGTWKSDKGIPRVQSKSRSHESNKRIR